MNHLSIYDYADNWLKTVKKLEVKPATYNRLLISHSTLRCHPISEVAICDLTTDAYKSYIEDLLNEGYSASTVKKQMLIISAPMRHAYDQRIIAFNPCASIKTPSKSRVRRKSRDVVAYDQSQQHRLIDSMRDSPTLGTYAIRLMLLTGMRVGEVLAIARSDIHLDGIRKFISIHATVVNPYNLKRAFVQDSAKSETSNRIIPISAEAESVLHDLLALLSEGDSPTDKYIFFGRFSYQMLRREVKNLCVRAGIPYYGMHVFRHTFATNMFYKGVNVKILSKLLGHSNTSVTYNTYIHLYGDGYDDMLKALS